MASAAIKAKAVVRSYADAAAFLGGSQAKLIAANTDIVRDKQNEWIAVRFYDTYILAYYPDGTFSVDVPPEHLTATTVHRLNQFGPNWARFNRAGGQFWVTLTTDGRNGAPHPVVLGKRYSYGEATLCRA